MADLSDGQRTDIQHLKGKQTISEIISLRLLIKRLITDRIIVASELTKLLHVTLLMRIIALVCIQVLKSAGLTLR